MKNYSYNFKIRKAFGNLYRKSTILLVVKNSEGKYLFGSKPNFYPEGITRLLGGGIHEGESLIDASKRELSEELNINLTEEDFEHIASLEISAKDEIDKQFNTTVNLVLVTKPIDEYEAGDDVKHIDLLTEEDIEVLISAYSNLSPELLYKGDEGEFYWNDFGRVYAEAHKIALDSTR